MSDVRQVKVDNWGIYFLQRLKHFFNRTDYCDLTLQFQDNAQLKVHRLVLNACTEYFELLERTCEMYEDCLVMPDDLQADVVVPIVNFMYTGHLEFRMELLERLYQTSQILNMPVLTKLLESHRKTAPKTHTHNYSAAKRTPVSEPTKAVKPTPSSSGKRSYSKAFDSNNVAYREKKVYRPPIVRDAPVATTSYRPPSPVHVESAEHIQTHKKRSLIGDRRPTRYELPEELDADNVFDNSFCNISYACKPLMIHPETAKRHSAKHSAIFSDKSSSKKLIPGVSTLEIAECKRITKENHLFDDNDHSLNDSLDVFQQSYNETTKDSSQLFDQIIDDGPKVTIETKDSKAASNLDHAKIISEVLKKYPHLVKSNKNIKLKILNTPSKGKKLRKPPSPTYVDEKPINVKHEPDYTYETDVIDSQQAAKLIAMGAENTKGPWICLICGTPGKALHFTTYFKFRRHLVEVHNEKPISTICEYCGLRAQKRHYLLYHLYSQHNVPPPARYRFPKCDRCNYIALTDAFLAKHKLSHSKVKNFSCNICSGTFISTDKLLQHIKTTGHKYCAERKTNLQCMYCFKTFQRHGNLYAHMKTSHEKEAKKDGVIDDSDDDMNDHDNMSVSDPEPRERKYHHVKLEPSTSYDIYNNENIYDEVDVQYEIQESHDGHIQLSPKKQHQHVISNQQHNSISTTPKQKILNLGIGPSKAVQKPKPVRPNPPERSTFLEDVDIPSPSQSVSEETTEEIVIIDNVEYIMKNNQLIPRKPTSGNNDYVISDMIDTTSLQPSTSMEYSNVHNSNIIQSVQPAVMVKKTQNINQPIQIVVSNEEEYKALMASNHPILFNDGDTSKTLTVLTTPHNTTMESAAIELNSTQSNDMMILPEDYPLNVTETVSTDNPNIVVVYSHPIDNQNKFQILTTGGIGTQFAQSSAIITQNYETITTTAPIMSAHVLESQPDTHWQDNIQSGSAEILPIVQHNNPPQIPQSEIQNDAMKSLGNEPISGLSELPEVHLTPSIQTMVTQNDLPNNASSGENVIHPECITQSVEQEIARVHHMPGTHIEPEILRENLIEEETTTVEPMETISHTDEHIPEAVSTEICQDINIQEPVQNENAVLQHENIVLETDNIVITQNENVVLQNKNVIVRNEEVAVQTENIVEHSGAEVHELLPQEQIAMTITENPVTVGTITNEHPEKEETNDAINEQPQLSQAYDDIVQTNHNAVEEPQSVVKADKIQNLTSEWSENEDENAAATLDIRNSEEVIRHANPEMLVESIENIQQEVINQINTKPTPASVIAPVPEADIEHDNSVVEDTVSSPQEPQEEIPALITSNKIVAPVINDIEAQEKISSLLNDWEDNDSQEESTSEDAVEENKVTKEVATENKPKPDIKSLVSDWDEEEEENKE